MSAAQRPPGSAEAWLELLGEQLSELVRRVPEDVELKAKAEAIVGMDPELRMLSVQALLAQRPQLVLLRATLALAQQLGGLPQAALQTSARLVAKFPGMAMIWRLHGELLANAGRREAALAAFAEVEQRCPAQAASWLLAARWLQHWQDDAGLLQQLQRACTQLPDAARLQLELLRALLGAGAADRPARSAAAAEAFDALLSCCGPDNAVPVGVDCAPLLRELHRRHADFADRCRQHALSPAARQLLDAALASLLQRHPDEAADWAALRAELRYRQWQRPLKVQLDQLDAHVNPHPAVAQAGAFVDWLWTQAAPGGPTRSQWERQLHWGNHAHDLCRELWNADHLGAQQLFALVDPQSFAALQSELDARGQRGAIIAAAHTNALPVCVEAILHLSRPLRILGYAEPSFRRVAGASEREQVMLQPNSRPRQTVLREAVQRLERGQWLGMALDAPGAPDALLAQLCGRRFLLSPLPTKLAYRYAVPIVALLPRWQQGRVVVDRAWLEAPAAAESATAHSERWIDLVQCQLQVLLRGDPVNHALGRGYLRGLGAVDQDSEDGRQLSQRLQQRLAVPVIERQRPRGRRSRKAMDQAIASPVD